MCTTRFAGRGWRRARAAMLCATILGAGYVAPSQAQSVPPPYVDRDSNGVDLVSGNFVTSIVEGSIGSGEGAVSLTRTLAKSGNWVDNWTGGLMLRTVSGTTTAYIMQGATADTFLVTGGGTVFTSLKGNGATLVANTVGTLQGYLYTAANGTKIQFRSNGTGAIGSSFPVEGYACTAYSSFSCSIPVSITKPNGMQYTIGYTFVNKCTSGSGPTCVGGKAYYRFSGVTSSAGYGFSIQYQTDTPGNGSAPQTAWYNKSSVTFSNANQPPPLVPTITYPTPGSGFPDFVDPAGRSWRFTGGNGNLLTGIQRPGAASASTVISYSGTPAYVSSITVDGVTTNYSRAIGISAAETTITDGQSGQTVVEANLASGRVTKVTKIVSPTNLVTQFAYDSQGRVTEVIYPEGNKSAYAYDSRGNLTSLTQKAKPSVGGADIISTSDFDATCASVVKCNQPNWIRDPNLNRTDFSYDTTTGQVVSVTLPEPAPGGIRPQTRYSYATIAGVSVLAEISTCQTLSSCVGASDEVKTTVAYNSNVLPTAISQGAGDGSLTATQSLTYDSRGNVLTLDGPLVGSDDTTTFRYDAANNTVGVISPDPDGSGSLKRRATKATYNADNQSTTVETGTVNGVTDADWAAFVSVVQSNSTYDSNGFRTKETVTAGGATYRVTQYSYDVVGRPECTALRMNLAATLGACTPNTTGAPDRVSKVSYDAVGRAVKIQSGYGTADQADDTTATYTANSKVATLADAQSNLTTYEYDGFDRVVKTRYPVSAVGAGSSSTTDYDLFGYDSASNLISRRLRDGQIISYAYDGLKRLRSKNLPSGEPDVTYGYDLLNRMTDASQSGNALSFSYDSLSRNTQAGGPLGTVSYLYDLAGRRIRMTWPDSFYVTYDYLVTGEMAGIKESGLTSLVSFTYNSLGQRTRITRNNGATTEYGSDAILRLSSLSQDMAGAGSDLTQTFTRNPAGQITSQIRNNDSYAWNGYYNVNRAYSVNGLNQIISAGSQSISYDLRGNLVESGSDIFAYSSENLLTGATVSGLTTSFAYDPLLRLQGATGNGVYKLQYDGAALIAEYDAFNTLKRRYVFMPGSDELLVEYDDSGNRSYIHEDERGSVIARTDAIGTSSVNKYDEYGIPDASNTGRVQYTGQLWMPEIGVYYYKSRYYSPSLGRFLQPDAIGYQAGMNVYAYVQGDPVNFIDPSGHDITCNDGTVVPESDKSDDPCRDHGGYNENTLTNSAGGGFGNFGGIIRFGVTGGSFGLLDIIFLAGGASGVQGPQPCQRASVIGKIWNSPNSALGLMYGGAGAIASEAAYGLGFTSNAPSISIGHNAIEFNNNIFAAAGAITLGNVTVYGATPSTPLKGVSQGWQHEIQHTGQGEVLGPFYLSAIAVSWGVGLIRDGDIHGAHSFLESGSGSNPNIPWGC